MASDRPAFERALVATSYVLGRRGAELDQPIVDASPETRRLVLALLHPDRGERSRVLAGELARLIQALDRRGLG
jgi:hypothetical protein